MVASRGAPPRRHRGRAPRPSVPPGTDARRPPPRPAWLTARPATPHPTARRAGWPARPSPEPDRWPGTLHRTWAYGGARHTIVPASVSDLVLGPEPLDQGHGLVHPAPALFDRHAKGRELFGRVPGTHPEDQAARGDHVDHRRLLRHGQRMVEREQEYGGPEPNLARPAGDGGQPDERRRIERAGIVVLPEPHRVEPGRLGLLPLADGLRELAATLVPRPARLPRRPPAAAVPRWRPMLTFWQF